jgi:diguanylate cyclase (GGDEF)-like protein
VCVRCADIPDMGLCRILFNSPVRWLGFWSEGSRPHFAVAASVFIALPPGLPVLSSTESWLGVAALFFLVLWVTAWRKSHRQFDQHQILQFELLARTEEVKRGQEDLALAREAMRVHAIRDELTGLPNRTSIVELLNREMERAVRDRSTMSVVLADIDHLGKINEAHGQTAGDEVLKEVGRRLEHAIRSYDAAGRFEGGEFLLVLPSFEADAGVERLRKIHDSICGRPMVCNGASLNVTCSFGVSILAPSHFYSSEELLERAGQAMSTAKQDGRNRIGFFARSEN